MPETASGVPLPPDELIDRVLSGFTNDKAEDYRALFLDTGQVSLGDLERALSTVGGALSKHRRILEFGCGCGRIMRWLEQLASTHDLVGTDIDARAIQWAAANLPFARFDVNEALPPTRYRDGEFDLIINHSVFTHLDEHYQDLWLAELQRITSPGGLLVLSIHGEHAFEASEQQLDPASRERREWRALLEQDGMLFIADDAYVGSAFPDFYHTAFHTPWYVFEHWSRWFDVLAYLPRSSLDFQDQVVLRPRQASGERIPIRARPATEMPASLESGEYIPIPAQAAAERPVSTPPTPDIANATTCGVLQAPTTSSRFGPLGLLARRAVFRAARPVLHAQHDVDHSFAETISSLEARLDERMPPLVHAALQQQAERIGRLESNLEELRHAVTDGPEPQVGGGSLH